MGVASAVMLELSGFQAQKRCPWTSLDGPGNLNLNNNILIFNDIYGLIFVVEYHLEYRFPKRYFAWDSNLRPSRMLGLSAGRSLN